MPLTFKSRRQEQDTKPWRVQVAKNDCIDLSRNKTGEITPVAEATALQKCPGTPKHKSSQTLLLWPGNAQRHMGN